MKSVYCSYVAVKLNFAWAVNFFFAIIASNYLITLNTSACKRDIIKNWNPEGIENKWNVTFQVITIELYIYYKNLCYFIYMTVVMKYTHV